MKRSFFLLPLVSLFLLSACHDEPKTIQDLSLEKQQEFQKFKDDGSSCGYRYNFDKEKTTPCIEALAQECSSKFGKDFCIVNGGIDKSYYK